MNVLRAPLLLAVSCVLLVTACGSDSAGEDPAALCKQGCTKGTSLCYADAGAPAMMSVQTICESACTSQATSGGKPCSNSAAMIAAYKVCKEKTTCADVTTCAATIPACQGGGSGGASGSTGGSSGGGSGGASGTGGSSGTGTGCADLNACCNATPAGQLKTACTTYYSMVMSMGDAACGQALTAIKALGACP